MEENIEQISINVEKVNKIRVFGRDKFGELSGMAQQYLFYYARENNIKI